MKDPHPSAIPIRLITHNVRYATSDPYPDELPWPQRKRGVISQLRYHTRESSANPFICLQEVLHEQLLDVHTGLNTPSSDLTEQEKDDNKDQKVAWAYIGVGRTDGKTKGEYNPIFYRQTEWTLLDSSTVWLSESPSKPSKGWDAASIRTLTVGVFRHNVSRKIVLAMNTHLDDQGSKAREEGANIILKVLRQWVIRGRRFDINGAFLAGDLNSQEGEEAYEVFNKEGSGLKDIRKLLPKSPLNENTIIPNIGTANQARKGKTRKEREPFQEISNSTVYYGDEFTFTAFGSSDPNRVDAPSRIDFLHLETADLVREKEEKWNMDTGDHKSPWEVQGYAVLPNKFDDGVWISDHRAVVGDVLLLK